MEELHNMLRDLHKLESQIRKDSISESEFLSKCNALVDTMRKNGEKRLTESDSISNLMVSMKSQTSERWRQALESEIIRLQTSLERLESDLLLSAEALKGVTTSHSQVAISFIHLQSPFPKPIEL